MTAAVGQAALAAGLVACLLAGMWWGQFAAGLQRGRPAPARVAELAPTVTGGAFAAAVVAAGAMEWALLTHDFSIRYVAENGSRALPTYYTVISLWAALAGSLLLWLVLLTAVTVAVTRSARRQLSALHGWALAVLNLVGAFFFGLALFAGDAFATVSPVPADGPGPNPLLQDHPLMGVHPPLLYVGYVTLTVPFAYALAALITGQTGPVWVAAVRRWTLTGWAALTVAVIMGGWWSYEVLGWGGYWAWDPVENAAVVPWFVATALLHTMLVQARRATLRVWNLSLALATYLLVLVGTFLTRSGVIQSVHSFTQSAVGPVLLGFILVALVVSGVLLVWRSDRLGVDSPLGARLSRESVFLVNNLLLAALALTVLIGTVFPLLAEAIGGQRLSVGAPYFNRITVPLILAILVLMGIGPLVPWGSAGLRSVARRLAGPAAVAVATAGALGLAGVRGLAPLTTFAAAAFVGTAIGWQYVGSVRQVRRRQALSATAAAGRVLSRRRRFYGGMLVHVGVVLAAVAVAASSSYTTAAQRTLHIGESVTVGDYSATLVGIDRHRDARRMWVSARLALSHDGQPVGVYAPALSFYPNSTQAIGTPSVRTTLAGDAYLTLEQTDDARTWAVVNLSVHPLVVWLWISAVVMAAGALVAGWPESRRRRHPLPEDDPAADAPAGAAAAKDDPARDVVAGEATADTPGSDRADEPYAEVP
ncbi:cytochrome c-type biogenesis protein CcmF [Modestobacter sp. DSM 44400]|uniref:heme lyase CcmF/NrfE family subunit n=1 Tax=Modestobacter sp. DSM 44400 TaxID=1550230 RepID=UPI000897FD75|nr:cytochrome c-type biogenesis CcmF C-terminal domain-containing protein [Modestobacter sp. DSM 44400]SDY66194.1 cytochrome c-type biogenesis protein CcmF [Modestobacter sp. DSM 44400]